MSQSTEIARIRRWWQRRPKHRHTWTYGRRSGTGWGIARCTSCGQEDLY